jgi:uncharacterized protein
MAASVLVDAGFLVALLNRRDTHHAWAIAQARRTPPPWKTCESALSEAFHLIEPVGLDRMSAFLEREAVTCAFDLNLEAGTVLRLIRKYASVPMSLADACLVRMTEAMPDPVLLTTDTDFTIYRRHGRLFVPVVMPG